MSVEGKDWKRQKAGGKGGEGKEALTVRKKARVSFAGSKLADEELTREKEK